MVAEALASAEALGAVPALICGDLNQLLGDLDAVAALAVSRWSEMGAPRPTCKTAQSKGFHRIDVVIANPALQARVITHHLWWVPTVCTHAMQRLDIHLGAVPTIHKWKKAPALPSPPAEAPAERAASQVLAFEEVWGTFSHEWEEARGNLDSMWTAISRFATACHRQRAGLEADPDRQPGRLVRVKEFPQPKGLDGAAATLLQDVRVLRWRRLSTLVGAWPRGGSS